MAGLDGAPVLNGWVQPPAVAGWDWPLAGWDQHLGGLGWLPADAGLDWCLAVAGWDWPLAGWDQHLGGLGWLPADAGLDWCLAVAGWDQPQTVASWIQLMIDAGTEAHSHLCR